MDFVALPDELLTEMNLSVRDFVNLALVSESVYTKLFFSEHAKIKEYTIYDERMKMWARHIPNKINVDKITEYILEMGSSHKLIIPRYINVSRLREDTTEIVSKSIHEKKSHIWEISVEIIKLWFPALATIVEHDEDLDWSDLFYLDSHIIDILQANGYPGICDGTCMQCGRNIDDVDTNEDLEDHPDEDDEDEDDVDTYVDELDVEAEDEDEI